MRYGSPRKMKLRKCTNDTDIFTMDLIENIPSREVIALQVEGNKYYCFHIEYLYEWAITRKSPNDPAYRFVFTEQHLQEILAFRKS